MKEVSPQPATATAAERGGAWAGEFAGNGPEDPDGPNSPPRGPPPTGPRGSARNYGNNKNNNNRRERDRAVGPESSPPRNRALIPRKTGRTSSRTFRGGAREFEEMQRGNPDWAFENVWDQVSSEGTALRAAERSQYQFTDPNPYLGRSDALEIGRDLFRRGVLSEAALALEAAVRADTQLCEGWRLLGTVHAENDDDRRAISAMTKANEADPTNLEVLLSLGVSHTNELDQEEATGHMRAWLRNQPRFAALEAEYAAGPHPLDTPESVLELFTRAAAAAPRDADVHAVLGVLAHLSRDYDRAISAFNTALEINPRL